MKTGWRRVLCGAILGVSLLPGCGSPRQLLPLEPMDTHTKARVTDILVIPFYEETLTEAPSGPCPGSLSRTVFAGEPSWGPTLPKGLDSIDEADSGDLLLGCCLDMFFDALLGAKQSETKAKKRTAFLGIVVVAPGYAAQHLTDEGVRDGLPVSLELLLPGSAVAELRAVQRALASTKAEVRTVEDLRIWPFEGSFEVRMSPEDRAKVQKYLTQAIARREEIRGPASGTPQAPSAAPR